MKFLPPTILAIISVTSLISGFARAEQCQNFQGASLAAVAQTSGSQQVPLLFGVRANGGPTGPLMNIQNPTLSAWRNYQIDTTRLYGGVAAVMLDIGAGKTTPLVFGTEETSHVLHLTYFDNVNGNNKWLNGTAAINDSAARGVAISAVTMRNIPYVFGINATTHQMRYTYFDALQHKYVSADLVTPISLDATGGIAAVANPSDNQIFVYAQESGTRRPFGLYLSGPDLKTTGAPKLVSADFVDSAGGTLYGGMAAAIVYGTPRLYGINFRSGHLREVVFQNGHYDSHDIDGTALGGGGVSVYVDNNRPHIFATASTGTRCTNRHVYESAPGQFTGDAMESQYGDTENVVGAPAVISLNGSFQNVYTASASSIGGIHASVAGRFEPWVGANIANEFQTTSDSLFLLPALLPASSQK